MLLPSSRTAKPAKSPARKLLDLVQMIDAHLRRIFIDPFRHLRRPRRRSHIRICPHPPVGVQALEARLNLTPVAVADNYIGNLDDTTVIPAAQGVLANDTGSSLTAVLVSGPSYGTVTLNADGSFSYTNTSSSDSDAFSYEDFDGSTYSNVVSVSLALWSGGAAPEVEGDDFTAVHDQTLNVSAPGVLTGANDPNNIPLTAVLVTPPAHGSLVLNSDGSLSYTSHGRRFLPVLRL